MKKTIGFFSRAIGMTFATFFSLLFLYLLNRYWMNLAILNESFFTLLWLINLSTGFSLLTGWILVVLRNGLLKGIVKLLQNIVSLIILINFLVIFPFNIYGAFSVIVHIVLAIIIFGVTIGTIVEFIKAIAKSDN